MQCSCMSPGCSILGVPHITVTYNLIVAGTHYRDSLFYSFFTSLFCLLLPDFIVFFSAVHSRFRPAGEVTCGETAERREELPHLLSASVWSL